MEEKNPGTSASSAYSSLRGDIVSGLLSPDEKLRVAAVAERYGCGLTPVREALNRLIGDSLVVYSQQRGFTVAPISRSELKDLTKARSMLSEIAIRHAIRDGDAAWEEQIVLTYHRLSRTPRYLDLEPPKPNPEFDQPHIAFHNALLAGCGSQWMLDLSTSLFDHTERYRNLARKVSIRPREDEHKQIMEATISRREEDAVRLLKGHIELTAEILLESDLPNFT